MKTSLSREQLTAHLQKYEKAELIEQLLMFFDRFPEVADFYYVSLQKDTEGVLKQYTQRILDALYPDERMEGGLDIDQVDHQIHTFDKLNPGIHFLVKIRLFAVQEATQVAQAFGGDYGEDFYIYFEEMYEAILKKLKQAGLLHEYQNKLLETAQNAFDGYGHYDTLMDFYHTYYEQDK